MKRLSSACLLFFSAPTLFAIAQSLEAGKQGDAQSKHDAGTLVRFNIAGRDFPVIVEANDVDDELIRDVQRDVQLLYQEFGSCKIVTPPIIFQFSVRNKIIRGSKFLDFANHDGYYIPQVLAKSFGAIAVVNGEETLVIAKDVVEAYDEARKVRAQWNGAFVHLLRFVDRLNAMASCDSMHDDEIRSVFYSVTDDSKTFDIGVLRRNFQELIKCQIRPPSYLDYRVEGGKLMFKTVLRSPETRVVVGEIVFVFASSKWRIGI